MSMRVDTGLLDYMRSSSGAIHVERVGTVEAYDPS